MWMNNLFSSFHQGLYFFSEALCEMIIFAYVLRTYLNLDKFKCENKLLAVT